MDIDDHIKKMITSLCIAELELTPEKLEAFENLISGIEENSKKMTSMVNTIKQFKLEELSKKYPEAFDEIFPATLGTILGILSAIKKAKGVVECMDCEAHQYETMEDAHEQLRDFLKDKDVDWLVSNEDTEELMKANRMLAEAGKGEYAVVLAVNNEDGATFFIGRTDVDPKLQDFSNKKAYDNPMDAAMHVLSGEYKEL